MTGASGFIGKHLTKSLLDSGVTVFGVSRSDVSPIIHKNYIHIKHDVRKPFRGLFNDIDIVFHLASYSTSSHFWKSPNEISETILLGTINAVDFCLNYGSKLFFASSYGAANLSKEYSFRDCYDVSKRAMETYIGDIPTNKLKSHIMRIPSVYGVGMPVLEDKIVSNFIRYLLLGKDSHFVMPKQDETLERTYLEVSLLIKQILIQIQSNIPKCDATGVSLTSYELYQSIERSIGQNADNILPRIKNTIEYFKASLA